MPVRSLVSCLGVLSALGVFSALTLGAVWDGIEVDIDARAIDAAAAIARDRRDAVVQAFHDRYVVASGDPRLDRVEVITEFRRAVMLGRTRVEAGNFTWTAHEIERRLQPWRGQLVIVVEVRFSPMHRLVSLPAYTVTFLRNLRGDKAPDRADVIQPLSLRTDAVYPVGATRLGDTVWIGSRTEVAFDARTLDPNGRYYFIVYEDKDRLTPVVINLSELR